MTKEELLRIYSAYLPYGLKVKFQGFESIYDLLSIGVSFDAEIISENKYDYDTVGIEGLIPILYSMDMLTQPIEHKGETFVPIDWLESNFNAFYYAQDTRFGSLLIKRKNTSMYHDVLQTNQTVNKLLEWHFNVFNLPESAYIKKENLKK